MPHLEDAADWWRSAVVYQIYIRSFADADGDGIGDIAGLRSRLPYLSDLGVDAIWINPWYPSPLADGGYDVADYRDVDPRLGTLAHAEAMIAEAHALRIRVLLDIVPNHTSDQHAWFQAALAAGPGSPERSRYIFRPGRGPNGELPPNSWQSIFGGPAWERVIEPDGRPGEWYLHLFAPEQPDVDWLHDEVEADYERTLQFWFDRGIDGFRIDVAHALAKDADLPDLANALKAPSAHGTHPFFDREEVHEIYRSWRKIADGYDPPRVFVAEAWVETPERLTNYIRPDELHTAFNFEFLSARWTPEDMRAAIDVSVIEHARVSAPPTWVLSNHDVARHVSRYARDQAEVAGHHLDDIIDLPADPEIGVRRARAAALLMLALPGGAYIYQGEELGLPEVEDLPDDVLQDPMWLRSGSTTRGRDGCRVPIPWTAEGPTFGFGPPDGEPPWLPQPDDWGRHGAEAQNGDPESMLELYRTALRLRRELPALGDGEMRWVRSPADALVFTRSPGLLCAVNMGEEPLPLPAGRLLLASGPLTDDGRLPLDTSAWLAVRERPPA